MTEDQARDWVDQRWDVVAVDRLAQLAMLVIAENERQNLIAQSTTNFIWSRHIVDSLQLVALAGGGSWLDIGTGGGFPGLAIAAAQPDLAMTLIEPRRRRAEFLQQAAATLGLGNVHVLSTKVAGLRATTADVISARAVAALSVILEQAGQCAHSSTTWLLPKGRNANAELANVRTAWHGTFHVEQSITDPCSSIIVATNVRRR